MVAKASRIYDLRSVLCIDDFQFCRGCPCTYLQAPQRRPAVSLLPTQLRHDCVRIKLGPPWSVKVQSPTQLAARSKLEGVVSSFGWSLPIIPVAVLSCALSHSAKYLTSYPLGLLVYLIP